MQDFGTQVRARCSEDQGQCSAGGIEDVDLSALASWEREEIDGMRMDNGDSN